MESKVELTLELKTYDQVPETLYGELYGLSGVTVFHQQAWHNFLQRVFGWKIRCIVGRDEMNRLVFFLPYVRKFRVGSIVNVCLPFGHDIGPAYSPRVNLMSVDLQSLVWPLEVHADVPLKGLRHISHHYVTALDLSAAKDEATLLRSFHPDKRRRIAIAERSGVHVFKTKEERDFAAFAELQSITRKRQGAPNYPIGFFTAMAEELGSAGMAELFLAKWQGRIVAGVIYLRYGTYALYGYGASVNEREILRTGANQAVMWAAIRHMWEAGCSVVDFGSTPKGQGELLRYKEQFGGVSRELVHSYGSSSGTPMDTPQDGILARLGGVVLKKTPMPLFKAWSPILLRMVV